MIECIMLMKALALRQTNLCQCTFAIFGQPQRLNTLEGTTMVASIRETCVSLHYTRHFLYMGLHQINKRQHRRAPRCACICINFAYGGDNFALCMLIYITKFNEFNSTAKMIITNHPTIFNNIEGARKPHI